MIRTRDWLFSAALVLATTIAQPLAAQRVIDHDYDRDGRYDRDDRWDRDRDGNYRGGMRQGNLRALADEVERISDSFKDTLDRDLDHSILDDTRKEKQLEERASRLENACDDVRESINDGEKFNHSRDRVKRALKYAQEMERDMRRIPLSPNVQSQWRQLTSRLDQLGYFFDLRPGRY